ncbi:MAG: 3-deoxy-manno-octulosonate cytidylyltransferase [Gammaproteobacteria bacterium]|nr:3-deoxy-manno-octulosonate cytidylyltransferase [Gammaproteobacteria bacterium]
MKAPKFTVIIPARLESVRLPQKVLADIQGIPMVVRVAQRALASQAHRVVVAGNHPTILEVCKTWNIQAILTGNHHQSGTERLAEAVDLLHLQEDETVVNVQGDEPLIDPMTIDAVAVLLATRADCQIATAGHLLQTAEDYHNPNVVKIALDKQNTALYFSRAAIPWWRDGRNKDTLPNLPIYRHAGIYAYKAVFLKKFAKLPVSPLETLESLEQLRALWHGYKIAVQIMDLPPSYSVDEQSDLDRVDFIIMTNHAHSRFLL